MANKAVAGWTQVPVLGSDILQETHTRLNAAGTVTDVTVQYQVRDSLGAVRFTASATFQSGAYPTSAATLIAACNTAQGT